MIAYAGPWKGEFGWELMTWQGHLRAQAHLYEKMYVCSFPGMGALYTDFCTQFIAHNHPGRALKWNDLSDIEFEIPPDVDTHIKPAKHYREPDQKFIVFGSHSPLSAFDYLIHARGVSKCSFKNYPPDDWRDVVAGLNSRSVASIGTAKDMLVEGSADLRGLPLDILMQYLNGCHAVVGGSSGVMHLATICNAPIVVWGDDKTYFGQTLEVRYKETWNPFSSEVHYVRCKKWNPEPDAVIDAAKEILWSSKILTKQESLSQ